MTVRIAMTKLLSRNLMLSWPSSWTLENGWSTAQVGSVVPVTQKSQKTQKTQKKDAFLGNFGVLQGLLEPFFEDDDQTFF